MLVSDEASLEPSALSPWLRFCRSGELSGAGIASGPESGRTSVSSVPSSVLEVRST